MQIATTTIVLTVNLTSQLFSNIYMNVFDKYVTDALGIAYYGRYVDDFILIHHDKQYLLSLINTMKTFLQETLHLTLHPKKIYFQHFSKGVKFLGGYIKPYIMFVDKRTKGNFYKLVRLINSEFITKKDDEAYLLNLRSSINSYLGTMIHFSSYKLRTHILSSLNAPFYNYFMTDKNLTKVVLKTY